MVGQAFSCASCNSGLVITSLSVPPTESTTAGAGEVGQTFTFTAANAAGAVDRRLGQRHGYGRLLADRRERGSNCIDVDVALNGQRNWTAASTLAAQTTSTATRRITSSRTASVRAMGSVRSCAPSALARTRQCMERTQETRPLARSSMTALILAPTALSTGAQRSPATSLQRRSSNASRGRSTLLGVLTSVGQWRSGATYVSYGDLTIVSGRIASLLGYVGGQSFPFTPGSGYTNGTTTQTATCTTIQSGGTAPRFDVTVAGGAIVNVVPSAAATGSPPGLGIGSTCTVPLPAGGTGGAIATITLAPIEGQGGIGNLQHRLEHDGHVPVRQFWRAGESAQSVLHQRAGRLFRARLAVAALRLVPRRGCKRVSHSGLAGTISSHYFSMAHRLDSVPLVSLEASLLELAAACVPSSSNPSVALRPLHTP